MSELRSKLLHGFIVVLISWLTGKNNLEFYISFALGILKIYVGFCWAISQLLPWVFSFKPFGSSSTRPVSRAPAPRTGRGSFFHYSPAVGGVAVSSSLR